MRVRERETETGRVPEMFRATQKGEGFSAGNVLGVSESAFRAESVFRRRSCLGRSVGVCVSQRTRRGAEFGKRQQKKTMAEHQAGQQMDGGGGGEGKNKTSNSSKRVLLTKDHARTKQPDGNIRVHIGNRQKACY